MENFNKYVHELLAIEIEKAQKFIDITGREFEKKADMPKPARIKKIVDYVKITLPVNQDDYSQFLAILRTSAVNEILTLNEYQLRNIKIRISGVCNKQESFSDYVEDFLNASRKELQFHDEMEVYYLVRNAFNCNNFSFISFEIADLLTLKQITTYKIESAKNFIQEIENLLSLYNVDVTEKFQPYQIVDFTQWWLTFILNQFEQQLTPKYFPPDNVQIGKAYTIEDMVAKIELLNFSIVSEIPLPSFYAFRISIRNLLASATNKDEVVNSLKALLYYSEKCIDIFNNILTIADDIEAGGTPTIVPQEIQDLPIIKQTLRLRISTKRKVAKVMNDKKFDRNNPTYYLNRDFAVFAVDIYNFLNKEIFKQAIEKEKQIIKRGKIHSLEELFSNTDELSKAIQALQRVKNPIIDSNNKYRLGPKKKTSLVAWINILDEKGKLNMSPNAHEISEILKNYFDGYSITAAAVSKAAGSSGYKSYRKPLELLID